MKKHFLSILIIAAVIWLLPSFIPKAQAVTIPEGGLIRAIGGIDVWIVKYVGAKQFRRLILNPDVFNMYGHLRWGDIKDVQALIVGSFTESTLVRALEDPKVYRLYPAGDTGERRWIGTANIFVALGLDWDAVYTINDFDRDSYVTGTPFEASHTGLVPAAPVLEDPGTSISSGNTFNITWSAPSLATNYTLQLDTNSSFTNPTEVYAGNLTSYFQTLTPQDTITYYWRVKARNNIGSSPWSKVVDMQVVVPAPPEEKITVTSPNGGEKWAVGNTYTIFWESTVIADGLTKVNIKLLSQQMGAPSSTYHVRSIASEVDVAKGFYRWLVPAQMKGPDISLADYPCHKIEVVDSRYGRDSSVTKVISDESDNCFTIVPQPPSIKVLSPNGGEEWGVGETYEITWASVGVDKINIKLLIYNRQSGQESIIQIASGISASPGKYSWTLPAWIMPAFDPKDSCKIGVIGTESSQTELESDWDWSGSYFSIVSPSVTVTSPNGGEVLVKGYDHTIRWTSRGVGKVYINIYFYSSSYNFMGGSLIAQGVDADKGFYIWNVSEEAMAGEHFVGSYYKIEVRSSAVIKDESDNCFTIIPQPASIKVLSPNGGEIWQLYSGHNITWTPDPESIYIEAYLDKRENGDFVTVGKIIPVGKGSIQWDGEIEVDGIVNYATPGDYYIKLVNTKTGTTDRSDESFQLVAANDFVKADLKVKSADGIYSDGPVTLETRTIQVSWSSAVADACRLVASSKDTHDVTSFDNLATSAVDKQILLPGNKDAYYVNLICDSSLYGGNTGSDFISVNILCPLPETPVLTDPGISVNSGESFALIWTGFIGGTLQRDTDPTFPNPRGVYHGQSPSPAETTTYYYRVNACNDCGCSSWSNVVDMEVIVPSITLTSPNGGEVWETGETYDIKWSSSGLKKFNIVLLDYRGGRWYYTIPSSSISASLDRYSWTIPEGIFSTGNIFKVWIGDMALPANSGDWEPLAETAEKSIHDESDNYFSIVSPSITLTSPNGGEQWVRNYQIDSDTCSILHCEEIEWSGGSGTSYTSVDAYLEQFKNNQFTVVGKIPPYGYGSISWPVGIVVPTSCADPWRLDLCSQWLVDPGEYYVRLVDRETGAQDRSDAPFSIVTTPFIIVTSPNGGESWMIGSTYEIKWRSEKITKVTIELLGPSTRKTIVNLSDNPKYYNWTIPSDISPSDKYKIRVHSYELSTGDDSDDFFSILPAPPPEP